VLVSTADTTHGTSVTCMLSSDTSSLAVYRVQVQNPCGQCSTQQKVRRGQSSCNPAMLPFTLQDTTPPVVTTKPTLHHAAPQESARVPACCPVSQYQPHSPASIQQSDSGGLMQLRASHSQQPRLCGIW
jgi:hypothetical protein